MGRFCPANPSPRKCCCKQKTFFLLVMAMTAVMAALFLKSECKVKAEI